MARTFTNRAAEKTFNSPNSTQHMDPTTLPLQLPTKVESQIKIRDPIKTPEEVNKEYVYRWWILVKSRWASKGRSTETNSQRFIECVTSAWPDLTKQNRVHALEQADNMDYLRHSDCLRKLHDILVKGNVPPPYKSFDHPAANAYTATCHLWADFHAKKSDLNLDDTDDELIEDVDLTLTLAVANEKVAALTHKRKLRDAQRCQWKKARKSYHEFVAQKSGSGRAIDEQD